jgi:hypothetical protein
MGRRTATVVLKLETIEIGDRTYDLKGQKENQERKEDAAATGLGERPPTTYSMCGAGASSRLTTVYGRDGTLLYESLSCPWQKLPATDRLRVFRAPTEFEQRSRGVRAQSPVGKRRRT